MGVSTAALTVEEFLNVPEPEDQCAELLEGEIISVGRGAYEHELVKANMSALLVVWAASNKPGKVFAETTFQLDEHTSLMPDVSFLLASRLVPGTRGLIQGAPELAVEIVSSESASVLERKISLYLAHGGRAVWAIYPEHRAVRVYDLNGFSRRLGADDVLEDQQLLPGFRTPVAAMFEGAATARSTSGASPSGAVVRTSLVAGLMTLMVLPDAASSQWPLMNSLPGRSCCLMTSAALMSWILLAAIAEYNNASATGKRLGIELGHGCVDGRRVLERLGAQGPVS